MKWNRLRRSELLVISVLVAGFALSGWKIFTRSPPANFSIPATQFDPSQSGPSVGMSASPKDMLSLPMSADGRYRFDARFVSSVPGQAVHAASIVELADGRLRAVWFSGSREGASDVAIKTSILNTESMQWGSETTLLDRNQAQQGLWRYVKKLGNPVIARLPDRSLGLWMVSVSLGGWAGSSIVFLRSVDDGFTWSRPEKLVTSPFLNISTLVKGSPIFYKDGQIGLPVYHEFITKFAEVLRLDQTGRVIDKVRLPGSHSNLQPVVLVNSPSNAQAYLRSGTSSGVTFSVTNNAGASWSPLRTLTLPNPDSALAGAVTTNGWQYLALNYQSNGRQSLSLLQSPVGGAFDNATPWSVEPAPDNAANLQVPEFSQQLGNELQAKGTSLEDSGRYVASAVRQLCSSERCAAEFSYPYLLQSRDGYLHLV